MYVLRDRVNGNSARVGDCCIKEFPKASQDHELLKEHKIACSLLDVLQASLPKASVIYFDSDIIVIDKSGTRTEPNEWLMTFSARINPTPHGGA